MFRCSLTENSACKILLRNVNILTIYIAREREGGRDGEKET